MARLSLRRMENGTQARVWTGDPRARQCTQARLTFPTPGGFARGGVCSSDRMAAAPVPGGFAFVRRLHRDDRKFDGVFGGFARAEGVWISPYGWGERTRRAACAEDSTASAGPVAGQAQKALRMRAETGKNPVRQTRPGDFARVRRLHRDDRKFADVFGGFARADGGFQH